MRVIRNANPSAAPAGQIDAMVVVGRKTSYRAQRIARRFLELGLRTVLVEGAAELDPAWFAGCETVGLTAGTSTPDATLEAIHDSLAALRPAVRS